MHSSVSPQRFWHMAALALVLGLASCNSAEQAQAPTLNEASSPSPAASSNAPKVVATSVLLCDLARQIGADAIDLTCLMQPGTDPHVYQPAPSDRRALEEAQLVLYTGFEYETSLERMIEATETPAPKVAVAEAAVPAPLMGTAHEHGHEHSDEHADEHGHEHGDEHTHEHGHEDGHANETTALTADPHVWHDPNNGARMAELVGEQIAALVPDQASSVQEKAGAIATELTQLDGWIKQQIATVPASARKLVTPHDSFRYFAAAYQLEVAGTIEGLSTNARPSAARMAELVELVKVASVPAVFAEQTTNKQLIETLANNANVAIANRPLFVEGPGTADSEAPTYQQMFVSNTCTIVNALGGTCDENSAPVGS
ncbi:metal ABC transporter substrate-binding protein [Leptolyngbya sp. AN02str]|uniref:metal ABC transporter substrate-binding protein n=1 Tax=Leptolyngbya sp. AN02str TaxID=3423363 RepID=UPI003D316E47